ncbi:hypothetical protein [Shinella sp. HZN7]|uniref:hypothetical protein n=1 Tax=Shinella sp. (strain HZN7) TaxID=879274 RepID=UPI0011AB5F00|nr:hypothetical protein [Shinella sp. HZN7]
MIDPIDPIPSLPFDLIPFPSAFPLLPIRERNEAKSGNQSMPSKRRTDPTKAMAEAEAVLTRAGVKFVQHSSFHLKVQSFNFWPSTGRIARGSTKGEKLGLAVFIRLLRDAGLTNAHALSVVNDPDAFIVKLPPQEPGFETY